MKLAKLRNLLLINLIAVNTQLLAQIMDPVQIKSPQSYAFEKYGNVPVNLYAGSIDLKIPIASIGAKDADISAILIYDSSGFIPHKKSDAAGVNWAVIAGGRITRKMNLIPDEYEGGNFASGNPYGQAANLHGFLKGIRSNPPSSNISAYNVNGTGTGHTNGTEWLMGSDPNNYYEGEPDEFNFNAMGLSGKFMIGNDGKVVVESSDPNIKVDISQMTTYGPGASSCVPPLSIITITDGKGNQYIFGGDLSKYEISYSYTILPNYPNTDYNGYPMINSFSLAKIILANKKEITFDYEEGTLFDEYFCSLTNWNNLRDNGKILSMDSYSQDGKRSDSWPDCNSGGCSNPTDVIDIFNTPSKTETFSLLKKSVLKSIKYQDDEIKINYKDIGYPIMHFTLSPFSANKVFNEWVISSVETYHKNLIITKQEFSYDDLGGVHKRPFLKSIENTNSHQTYKFEYYKTDNLPAYYTKGIDHWGYWNGLDNNESLSPFTSATTYGDYTLVDTFRDANAEKYNVALLKTITYPTKGFSVFEYEPQRYAKRVERIASEHFLPSLTNNGGLAGGARIKSINSYTENAVPSSKKEYKYTTTLNGSSSSGILMTWPRYYYHIQMLSGGKPRELLLRASSNVQVNSLDSYNVGYSNVFEIEEGKGYIKNSFSTYETNPDLISPENNNYTQSTSGFTNIHPVELYLNLKNIFGIDQSTLRGRFLTQQYFSQADLISPIKTVDYSYFPNTMNFNINSSLDNNNYVSVNHSSGIWTQAYRRFMNSALLKTKITRDYLNTAEIKTTTDYIYDATDHLNLTNERLEDTDGNILETKYKYAKDYSAGGDLNNWNFTGIPLLTTKYKNNVPVSRSKLNFNTNWTGHAKLLPSSQQSVINLDKIDKSGEVLEDQVTYGEYDNKGNLLEYTTKNGLTTTIIYGYNRTLPIAKIEGMDYVSFMTAMGHPNDLNNYEVLDICQKSNDDSSQALRSDEMTFLTALDSFRKQLPNYKVTTYTYDPLIGVRSITPPSGVRENYTYDTANRLKEIRDVNGKILKEYRYEYNSSTIAVYFNSALSKVFRNLNCSSNSLGSAVTYSVPANKYISNISQADADYQAEMDLNTNGQALANATGTCELFSCPVTLNSSLDISGTSSIYAIQSEGVFILTLSFTTGANSTSLPWDGDPGVKIANISGSCRPSETILGGDHQAGGDLQVFWSLRPNGDLYIDNTPAPGNNSSQTWVLRIPFY